MRMRGAPGLHLPSGLDTLLLQAAIHQDERGLEAWQCLRPHFSVDAAHAGQLSLLPLVHRTLCATGASDPDRERLAGQRRFLMSRWAWRAGPLAGALRRMEEANVAVMLVGEAARGQRLDEDDHSLRNLGEILLLVHPSERDRAINLLDTTDPIRLMISASDRLAHPGPGGDSAWEQAEVASLAGCSVLRPSATDLLLHTLVDGTRFSHGGRIRWAADAAQLIRAGGIDWRRLAEQAERRRVAVTAATALAYLASALEVPLPLEAPTRAQAGLVHRRERLINRLWSDGAQGPCHRNAIALVLAQSAAQPPLISVWGVARRAAAVGVAKVVSEGRHGLRILKRIRHPAPLLDSAKDRPKPECFTGTVVVASTQRSGSSLLCSALGRTGLVGVPKEYLLPRFLESGHRVLGAPLPTAREQLRRIGRLLRLEKEWWGYREIRPSTMAAYIHGLAVHRSSANGIFALKVHWQHFEQALRMGFVPSQLPQPITWIHIERRDRIAQAVSFAKAMRSGAFSADAESPDVMARLRYDDSAILKCYENLQQGVSGWKSYFESQGITPLPVIYEDLVSDYEGTITRVLEALGYRNVPVPPPMHRRQSDAMNQSWIAAFLHDHPELAGQEWRDDADREPSSAQQL